MRVVRMMMRTIGGAKVVCAVLACLLSGIAATFVTAWIADHGQPLYFPTTGVLEGYNGDWPHPMPRENRALPGLGDGPMGGGGGGRDGGREGPTHVSRAHEWNRDRLLYTASDPNTNVMFAVTGFGRGMDCVITGVPFRALTRWSRMRDGAPEAQERHVPSGAFKVGKFGAGWLWGSAGGRGGSGGWGGWTLPVHPIWPGFAYNVAIYSVAAWGLGWMVWQVPRAIRGRRRRARGCCVRCGYDLKGLAAGVACPECGAVS